MPSRAHYETNNVFHACGCFRLGECVGADGDAKEQRERHHVVFDTHTQELSDDVANSTVLLDDKDHEAGRSRGKALRPAGITAPECSSSTSKLIRRAAIDRDQAASPAVAHDLQGEMTQM
jgi:hypothetical protein